MIFDKKKTHAQLVQRSQDTLKLYLSPENHLKEEHLKMFWALSKSDYKVDVYKILNDVALFFSQNHTDVIFEEI